MQSIAWRRCNRKIEVHTGFRQGYILSPPLFLMAIDWVMKKTTTGKKGHPVEYARTA
jgi:hypothetical protein